MGNQRLSKNLNLVKAGRFLYQLLRFLSYKTGGSIMKGNFWSFIYIVCGTIASLLLIFFVMGLIGIFITYL